MSIFVGKTKWRTCFSSISFNGFKVDILKSAMQKYLRRRNEYKMIWCVKELYLFKALARTELEVQASKGIITNLINRIIIMLDEELLFAEWNIYIKCRLLIEEFETSNRNDISKLIIICKILCKSELLRLNSDISSYWWRAIINNKIKTPNSITDINIDIDETNIFIKNNMLNFINCINNKNPECYYYAFILFNSKEKSKRRFKRNEGIYIIWEYLINISINENNINLQKCLEYKLKEFYVKNRNERHMFLSSAISLIMHREDINWNSELLVQDIIISNEEIIKLFKEHKLIEIDSYAIDMHTSLGRKLGKDKKDFAKEGSYIENENKKYLNLEWRNIYNKEKINVEVKPIEDSIVFIDHTNFEEDKIQLCTNKTCGGKVMCFEYEGYIWKEGRKSMNYHKDYICVNKCKKYFGLNEINMKIYKSNFILEKKDKNKSEWTNNFKKTIQNNIIYCRMKKIGDGNNLTKDLLINNIVLKELIKIALFRGIFRVTDFCLRNILIDENLNIYSIDENDINKRTDIFGKREKWLINIINKSELLLEVYNDIMSNKNNKLLKIKEALIINGFSEDVYKKIQINYNNLIIDLNKEGFNI